MLTQPSVNQVEARLPLLSRDLRSAIFSMEVTELGRKLGSASGLDRDHIPLLADVIAWVLMGFMHPTNAVEAIQEHVGVSIKTAKDLAEELNAKLFKKYAAELEKIYAPPAPTPSGPPAPMSPDAAPAPLGPTAPAPKAPAVKKANMGVTAVNKPFAPAPQTAAKQPAAKTPAGPPPSVSIPKKEAGPAPTPAGSKPAPFILHKEASTNTAPLAAGKNFRLDMPADLFRSPQKTRQGSGVPLPPKTARLEIGKPPVPPGKQNVPVVSRAGSETARRVVHYSDLRSAVSSPFAPRPDVPPAKKSPAPQAPEAPVSRAPSPPRTPSATAPPMPTRPQAPKESGGTKQAPKVVDYGPEEVQ